MGYNQHLPRKYPKSVTDHPLYPLWRAMRNRCYVKSDTNYEHYGSRGIRVVKEWAYDPWRFIVDCLKAGWKKGLQIDRKDNDGPYALYNVQFVTAKENCANRRVRKDSRLGIRGVLQRGSRYRAHISINGTRHWLGTFDTIEDAVFAREMAL